LSAGGIESIESIVRSSPFFSLEIDIADSLTSVLFFDEDEELREFADAGAGDAEARRALKIADSIKTCIITIKNIKCFAINIRNILFILLIMLKHIPT
jgi:hypothetical protein